MPRESVQIEANLMKRSSRFLAECRLSSRETCLPLYKRKRREIRKLTLLITVDNYLLSGIIYCSECGGAITDNRKFSSRSKLKYVLSDVIIGIEPKAAATRRSAANTSGVTYSMS